MKTWFDRARAIEAADRRVLQASNYPDAALADVAEGGWATMFCTDNDRALAERLADELADLAWSMRADFQKKDAVPIDEAVRMADIAPKGLVVLSDTGDTVFGGSSGDSNLILESILRQGIQQPGADAADRAPDRGGPGGGRRRRHRHAAGGRACGAQVLPAPDRDRHGAAHPARAGAVAQLLPGRGRHGLRVLFQVGPVSCWSASTAAWPATCLTSTSSWDSTRASIKGGRAQDRLQLPVLQAPELAGDPRGHHRAPGNRMC